MIWSSRSAFSGMRCLVLITVASAVAVVVDRSTGAREVIESAGYPYFAAISLQLVGHAALGDRLGRNARFGSIGNGITAAVMGTIGAWLSSGSVFWLTAAFLA